MKPKEKSQKRPNLIVRGFYCFIKNFQLCWYTIMALALSIYIFLNWTIAIDFVFFSDFDGNNLLFLVWIVLLILPLISKFEGLGLTVKSTIPDILSKKADELTAKKDYKTYSDPDNIEKLEKRLLEIDVMRGEESDS